ncbi:hypothetical protein JX266_001985 [Neoarthrinium moseri]|nr:hypothetical protein JX266_001985 [Neoarthrinium moseri]
MSTAQDPGRPLEDHLRNLILSNNETSDVSGKLPGSAGDDLNRTEDLAAANKGPKKRPNQAQRRQMKSQLTIPIDPRATGQQPARPNVTSSTFNSRGGRGYHHSASSRHQPAGFHGGSQGHLSAGQRPQGQGPGRQQYNRGYNAAPSPTQTHQHAWERQYNPHAGQSPQGANTQQSDTFAPRPSRNAHGSLYNPGGYRQYVVRPEELAAQTELLEHLCARVVEGAEIEHGEIVEKETFRVYVEQICRSVVSDYEINVNGASRFEPLSVQLRCFGSLASGFATKAADMDLGLLSPASAIPADSPQSHLPRLIEKALLNAGFGARLLTRTRIPIIKLCEKPTEKLREDLLHERSKWEMGLTDDDLEQGEDETGADDDGNGAAGSVQSKPDTKTEPGHSSGPGNEKATKSPQRLLASVKQSDNQSLLAYHNNTKKLLRQLDGRDVTHSNVGVFTDSDYLLLDDISRAFVDGLDDEALKGRIKAHPSFSAGRQGPNYRTLHGVCNMAEGEKLVMLWETRAIPEGDARAEQSHLKAVQWWTEFHSKRAFGTDPLSFNREMFLILERLRKIPSVQLMQLQQDQYESATEYHERARKAMMQLDANALAASEAGVAPPAIQYYVSGIRDKDIRSEVERFVLATGTKNLRAVARRHKSLHLAADYVRALEKGDLYGDDDTEAIKQYVGFLRCDFVQTSTPNEFDFGLPLHDAMIAVYDRILQLPNPSALAPNQPKDRYHDKLEFPQKGVGVQCDINFSADLALQNSLLLRCYAATDPRVRPMVLFVKHWAKARGINTPYRGTLSSYGYVLMVLHYLVNIAHPFVCPNLQVLAPPDPDLPPEVLEGIVTCKGRNVRFWRDEQEIRRLSHDGVLNNNQESLGSLLRGFFEYFAQNNMMSTIQKRGFDWGRDVLSLRTPGGLLTKQDKDWVQAKTTRQSQAGAPPTPTDVELLKSSQSPAGTGESLSTNPDLLPEQPTTPNTLTKPLEKPAKPVELKEVRHRFLFALEDPFEHEHNVARTVTHNGIVSIRDEFRRAWRIIKAAGKTAVQEDLLEDTKMHAEILERQQFVNLLTDIHGLQPSNPDR